MSEIQAFRELPFQEVKLAHHILSNHHKHSDENQTEQTAPGWGDRTLFKGISDVLWGS